MKIKISFFPYQLAFSFQAATSRGIMKDHQIYLIRLHEIGNESHVGWGEVAPLPGLSPDLDGSFEEAIKNVIHKINAQQFSSSLDEIHDCVLGNVPPGFPALRFGLETALMDWLKSGKMQLFDNPVSRGEKTLPINGLVWMGSRVEMVARLKEKVRQGFKTIKFKVGGIDFEEELSVLRYAREVYGNKIEIRLDANGAFSQNDVFDKLEKLSVFHIHSIEQPVKPENYQLMKELCQFSPIPVALDEQLIRADNPEKLLEDLKPTYIILKPTLLGGLNSTSNWISIAEKRGIGWWVTSALESNIGLNAITQFCGNYPIQIPQGLGTGQLYTNNFSSPWTIRKGKLFWDKEKKWAKLAF